MGCSGTYSTAWDFASFWCIAGIVAGLDDSAAGPNLFLTDSTVDFTDPHTEEHSEIGNPIKNFTTGTYGFVTVVNPHVLTTTNAWSDGNRYALVHIGPDMVATIEVFLDIAANDIHAARAASGGCDCSLATWASAYLGKLNLIDAAVIHNCPCGNARLTDAMKGTWLEWVSTQLENIVTQRIELCDGYTGSDFPAQAFAQQALTPWRTAEIMYDDLLRGT